MLYDNSDMKSSLVDNEVGPQANQDKASCRIAES